MCNRYNADKSIAHYKLTMLCLCVGTMNYEADKKETKGITGIFIQTPLLTHYKAKKILWFMWDW